MHTQLLRILVTIAGRGSFAAAARELGVSESTVSAQVRTLERHLGFPVFDRARRPPVLNDSGRRVVERALAVLAGLDGLSELGTPAGSVEGRLRLGAVGSTLTGLLPQALAAIRRRHPSLHIEVVSGFSDALLSQIERRRLDAAIVSDYQEAHTDLDWRPVLRERLVVIAPPDAPAVPVHELVATYPFIRYSPNAAVGRVIDLAVRSEGLQVREGMKLDWLEAIEAMVFHGHGIAVVPERAVGGPGPFGVRQLDLAAGRYHRTLGLIEPVAHARRTLTDAVHLELIALARRRSVPPTAAPATSP